MAKRPTPLIAITPWRRTLTTWVHTANDLYTLDPEYITSVETAGGVAVIVPHVSSTSDARSLLHHFDGLIISGGSDVDPSFYGQSNTASADTYPLADTSDIAFIEAAAELALPVLAICRGPQIMNVAFGGTLKQHIWSDTGHHPARNETGDATADADAFLANRHSVTLSPGSLAAKLFDNTEIFVNSIHHQSVDRLGQGLRITGRAPDGIVEVIEHDNGRMIGVQWHPERLAGEGHGPLFEWLVEAAISER